MGMTFCEPGGDSTFDTSLWPTVSGSPSAATDFVHGAHVKSIKYGINTNDYLDTTGAAVNALTNASGRVSFYFYFNAGALGNRYIGRLGDAYVIVAGASGILRIWDTSNNELGSVAGFFVNGSWHRFSCAYTITSTTVNVFKVYLDGVLQLTITNATLQSASNTTYFQLGSISSGFGMDLRTSDHYCDDSNALTDPGNIWVTAKRPNANGTTNGFTTQIGSGGSSYGSGHSPQVNERPLSQTNGWSMIGAGSAVTEEYTIESAGTGDIDISTATIVDYMGWVSAKALTSETASIVVGGSNSNISLTSTITIFQKMAGSSTYPSTGAAIGIITATTVTTVSLYECGIVVAYIPAVVPPPPYRNPMIQLLAQ